MNRKERRRLQKTNIQSSLRAPNDSALNAETMAQSLNQANIALGMGNPELAANLIDGVLNSDHNNPDALNLKAALLMSSGEVAEAVRIFTKVIKIVPNFAQAHFNLGSALTKVGKPKRAIKSLQQALKIEPDYADAHYNLANALRQIEQTDVSIKHYSQTLRINPDHSGAATNLASAHLELGQPNEAYEASVQAQTIEPGNRDAIAFTAIAATEKGDKQTSARILNPDLLVRPKQFDIRPGFDSLAAFNAALVDHVLTHPTLAKEPRNKATRNGQQTDNLALGDGGTVAELQAMIGEALDEYLEAINLDKEHPYPPLIPKLTKIDIWGTVLEAQGHQAAHMHRAAWVSGVYYAKLPDVMHSGEYGNAGCIEFCRPPDEFPCTQQHDVKIIQPQEGTMVLFPSYMYHRTIPFESTDKRISIAFDLQA